MGDFFITISELKARLGRADCPPIFDVRRRPLFDESATLLPTARWRDHRTTDQWTLPGTGDVVVYCVHGHNVSQGAAAALRARGVYARVLAGGIDGWREAGGVLMTRNAFPHRDEDLPSTWVTHRCLKIDRLTCLWLIRRFIDREARFIFVERDQVAPVAEEIGGIAFGVPGGPFTPVADRCTFDTLIERFTLKDTALQGVAEIIRGADKVRPHIAPEAPGLVAMSLGISALAGDDDHAALNKGMYMYDALYAWQKHAADETHNWPKATSGQGAG